MKNSLSVIFIFLFYGSTCISQENTSSQYAAYQTANYSNVRILVLINYDHGLSSGSYFYPEYRISCTKSEFLIEAKTAQKQRRHWQIPLAGSQIIDEPDENPEKYLHKITGHYFSDLVTYNINGTPYTVYEHANYNCYDPQCGNKHSHIPFQIGVTYFSPEYGILVQVDNQDMQYQLMSSMKEKTVPHDLVIEILKRRKTDEKIIREYRLKAGHAEND